MDEETMQLLEKFDKNINPHINKVIDKIDKRKQHFSEQCIEIMKIHLKKKKNTGNMSVENALEDLSDEESNSSHGASKLMSENLRIDVKP